MKAIDLRKALIEANSVNLDGADALNETSALRQLIKSCEERIAQILPEAEALAREELNQFGQLNGQFVHDGHTFELQRDEVFDFVGKPQKYTMEEGVVYRQQVRDQKVLKAQSAAITKSLKAIRDAFPDTHPNVAPDEVKYVLKCID